jgi:hypothetical protein
MKCRYTGHTSRFYSVAEHCVHVSNHVHSRYALWGLLHDASEAYLPDVSRTIKPCLSGFVDIEYRVMGAVVRAFDLSPLFEPEQVKAVDTAILHDEKLALMPNEPMPWGLPGTGLGVKIECWSPVEAEVEFLRRFSRLAL